MIYVENEYVWYENVLYNVIYYDLFVKHDIVCDRVLKRKVWSCIIERMHNNEK